MARTAFYPKLIHFSEILALRDVPSRATWTWFRIATLIHTMGDGQSLLFDGDKPSLTAVAGRIIANEHDVRDDIEILVAKRAIVITAAGVLTLPEDTALSAKARAARENGARGGRPRKIADGRQTEALMALPGGKSGSAIASAALDENPSETQRRDLAPPDSVSVGFSEPPTTTTTTFPLSESDGNPLGGSGGGVDSVPAIARELAELLGKPNLAAQPRSVNAVRAMLGNGCSTQDIRDAAVEIAADPPDVLTSLGYLKARAEKKRDGRSDVRTRRQTAPAAPPAPGGPPISAEEAALKVRVDALWERRRQDLRGPLPGWSALRDLHARPDGAPLAAAWVEWLEAWRSDEDEVERPPELTAPDFRQQMSGYLGDQAAA